MCYVEVLPTFPKGKFGVGLHNIQDVMEGVAVQYISNAEMIFIKGLDQGGGFAEMASMCPVPQPQSVSRSHPEVVPPRLPHGIVTSNPWTSRYIEAAGLVSVSQGECSDLSDSGRTMSRNVCRCCK